MKKLVFLFSLLFSLFVSCEKEAADYVKEANKAMEQGNYQKAYNIYDEMKANNPHTGVPFHGDLEKEYDRACQNLKESIIKNEIATVIEESEGSVNTPKIVFIIEDKGNNNTKYYEYAIKLAKASNNEELAENISNVMNGN